jgi:hypothetical protein
VPVFAKNEAVFEKIDALFLKNDATFGKPAAPLLQQPFWADSKICLQRYEKEVT